MNNYYIPYVESCNCPNCNKNILIEKEKILHVGKCKDCNIEIHKLIFSCQIIFENYVLNLNKKQFSIVGTNKIIYSSYLEEDFNWNNISQYYKQSLKIIENLIFL